MNLGILKHAQKQKRLWHIRRNMDAAIYVYSLNDFIYIYISIINHENREDHLIILFQNPESKCPDTLLYAILDALFPKFLKVLKGFTKNEIHIYIYIYIIKANHLLHVKSITCRHGFHY